MYYIGKDDVPLSITSKETCNERIMMYDHKAEDYFLEYCMAWQNVQTPIYTVLLGDKLFNIPSSQYVVCGDVGGDSDVIVFDEIIGRNIAVITIVNGYRKVEWNIPRIISINDNGEFLYPMVSKLPVLYSKCGGGFILMSGSDRLGGKTIEYEELIV